MTANVGNGGPGESLSQPLYGAGMGQAVARFFKKYARFRGFASRSEYWWAVLFHFIVFTVVSTPYYLSITVYELNTGLLSVGAFAMLIWSLGTMVPMLAVAWRRLHDAGYPGPMYFLTFIPVIGPIVLLILLAAPTRKERHRGLWADPAGD